MSNIILDSKNTIEVNVEVIERIEYATSEDQNWWTQEQKNKYVMTGEEPFNFLSLMEEVEEEEENLETEIVDFYLPNYNMNWKKCYDLTNKSIDEAKAIIKKWSNKSYKKSNKSVFVGDEINGRNVSINSVNARRKNRTLIGAEKDLEIYESDLRYLESVKKIKIVNN